MQSNGSWAPGYVWHEEKQACTFTRLDCRDVCEHAGPCVRSFGDTVMLREGHWRNHTNTERPREARPSPHSMTLTCSFLSPLPALRSLSGRKDAGPKALGAPCGGFLKEVHVCE